MIIFANQVAKQFVAPYPSAALVSGDDQVLTQDAIQIILDRIKQPNTNLSRISIDAKADLTQLTHLGQQSSLFATHTIYLITCKNWRLISSELPAILKRASNSNDHLIFIGPALTKAQTLAKWVKAIDAQIMIIRVTPLRPQDLPLWIQEKARQYQIALDAPTQQFLLEHACQNLAEIDANLRLLGNLFPKQKPSLAEIRAVIIDAVAASPWDISQALLDRKVRPLRQILKQCLANKDHLAIIATLGRDLERILLIFNAPRAKQSPGELLKKQGVWPNQQAAYINFARQTKPQSVTYAIAKLSKAEIKFKTGHIPESTALIEQAVLEILCAQFTP